MAKPAKSAIFLAGVVRSASQGAFLPFTPLPDHFAGRLVAIILISQKEAEGIESGELLIGPIIPQVPPWEPTPLLTPPPDLFNEQTSP